MSEHLVIQPMHDQSIDVLDEGGLKQLAQKFEISEQMLTIRLLNSGLTAT
jgi:hypothetical protein